MTYRGFEAARLKIARARYHVAALNSEMDKYYEQKSICYSAAYDEPYFTYRVEVRALPSLIIPALIGDAVHNLRSSLDIMASDIVRLNGKDPSKVYFPFANDESGLEEMIKQKKMNLASPEAVDLVRNFRPFKGGNVTLRGIHDLDIADKHQALIPVASLIKTAPSVSDFYLSDLEIGIESDGRCQITNTDNDWLKELGDNIPVRIELLFPEDTPFAGKEIISELQNAAKMFLGVIEAFELLIFGAIAQEPLNYRSGLA